MSLLIFSLSKFKFPIYPDTWCLSLRLPSLVRTTMQRKEARAWAYRHLRIRDPITHLEGRASKTKKPEVAQIKVEDSKGFKMNWISVGRLPVGVIATLARSEFSDHSVAKTRTYSKPTDADQTTILAPISLQKSGICTGRRSHSYQTPLRSLPKSSKNKTSPRTIL